ncbi:MAG: 50S ribosomal protein L11 methyltransferase [Dehalococcoidia bacterium]
MSLECPPEFVEPLSHVFYRYGEGGTAVESPSDYNPDDGEKPPVPEFVTIRTYLPIDHTTQERLANIEVGLKLVSILCPIGELQTKEINDIDWENKWKDYFFPIPVGEKILICPTWRDVDNNQLRNLIYLDPGMAFGTGHHPTTRMCLELLEKVIENNSIVLDFGSGSGILSIAATKLGAKKCVGIEIEPNAVKSANENILKNNVQENVMLINDEFNQSLIPNIKFNLVIANISTKIIVETFEKLDFNLQNSGGMILSGILKDSFHQVETLIEKFKYQIDELLTENDWIAVRISKN